MENSETNQPKPAISSPPLRTPQQPLDFKKQAHPFLHLLPLIVLGFGLAAVAFSFLSKSITKKIAPKVELQKIVQKPLQDKTATIVEVAPPPSSQKPGVLETSEQKPIPTLVLTGILFSGQGSMALINGKVVPEGAMIEGVRLEKIYSDKVELNFEGKKITLRQR